VIGEFASRIETDGKEQLRRPRLSIYEVAAPEEEGGGGDEEEEEEEEEEGTLLVFGG
jgi:hypothetical protein